MVMGLVTLPFRIIIWLFKHPKTLVLVLFAVFALVGFRTCQHNMQAKAASACKAAEFKQQIAPAVNKAPYILQTDTRVYYLPACPDIGEYRDAFEKQYCVVLPKNYGEFTLKTFYSYDSKKWVLNKKPLPINTRFYGEVVIYDRTFKK